MLKEIIINDQGRKDIENLTIGVFPPKGRYYRKKMINSKHGFFWVELDLPSGISYYHLYLNNDFTTEYLDINTPVEGQDLCSRNPIVLKSEIFNHIIFHNSPQFISYIDDNTLDIKLISYFSRINWIQLINENNQYFDFKVIFEHQNKKYWNLRYTPKNETFFQIKFSDNSKNYWLNRNHKASLFKSEITYFKFPSQNRIECNNLIWGPGYHIFPDTFSKSEMQEEKKFFQNWNSEPETFSYYGGDLRGIINKIDVVKNLDIQFVYLSPVFKANSAHRYDTVDYRRIDPILGTEADFLEFVEILHYNNIKLILDISLNHCSTEFFAFKDVLEKQEYSAYKDWFIIENFPVTIEKSNYSCWHGYKELPQFNFKNKEVQQYLIESALYWIQEFDIDGWRIDVSNEIPDHFLYKFNRAMKKVKNDILIIGENLHNESTDFVYWNYGDGITAYSLYQDVLSPYFLEGIIGFSQLVKNIMEYCYSHSFKALNDSWTFLSNHDLPRFYSFLKNTANYKLAFSLLIIIPGVPIYYYGEEIKLSYGNLNSRYPMCWNEYSITDNNFMFIKDLNFINKQNKELFKYGNLEVSYFDKQNEVLGLLRRYKNEAISFLLNFSNQKLSFNKKHFENNGLDYRILRGKISGSNHIYLPPKDIAILKFNSQ